MAATVDSVVSAVVIKTTRDRLAMRASSPESWDSGSFSLAGEMR